MKCFRSSLKFLIFFVLLLGTSSSWASEPNDVNLPLPGKIFPFSFEGLNIVVQVPEDYNDINEVPMIFYYHGSGGKANVDYLKYVTESKGFILVGMSYTFKSGEPISSGRYTNYLKNEVRRLGRLKKYLEEELQLKVDDRKMFVGGISKGGWFSYDVFEYRPSPWAGALVIAAGRSQTTAMSASEKPKNFKGKPVYIGVGETDVNRKAAERAHRYLERVEADGRGKQPERGT